MNFQELVDIVVQSTGRPDMDSSQGGDGYIQTCIATATAYLHGIDFFFKDIIPVQVQFDQANYIQTLNTQVMTRYRLLSWARKNDISLAKYQQNPTILPPLFNNFGALNYSGSMSKFVVITPDQIFDEEGYGSEKTNVCYQAGDTIFFKSNSAFVNILFGYYAFPNVDISENGKNFSSWIARDFPFAITAIASANIFNTSGKTEAAKRLETPDGAIATWTRNILISNIEAQGR